MVIESPERAREAENSGLSSFSRGSLARPRARLKTNLCARSRCIIKTFAAKSSLSLTLSRGGLRRRIPSRRRRRRRRDVNPAAAGPLHLVAPARSSIALHTHPHSFDADVAAAL